MTAKKKPAADLPPKIVSGYQGTGHSGAPSNPPTGGSGGKRAAEPVLQAVAADHEEVAMAKLVAQARTNGDWTGLTDREVKAVVGVSALSPLQEEVVSLLGQLRDAEAARERAVTALRKDLDAADIIVAQAETVAREALHDLAAANARVKDLEGHESAHQSDEAGWKREVARKQQLLDNGSQRITELGSDLDAAEDRIGHLEAALAHEQRGWIARLFRRPAGGRA